MPHASAGIANATCWLPRAIDNFSGVGQTRSSQNKRRNATAMRSSIDQHLSLLFRENEFCLQLLAITHGGYAT